MFENLSYKELSEEFSRIFPSFQTAGGPAFKPGLERVLELCRAMDSPHLKFPCIHVAGTNGKGSTSNMLAATLAQSGRKTGLYTSPHILDLRERIRIVSAGSPARIMDEEAFAAFLRQYGESCIKMGLSYFEVTTAMAFWHFAREKVDAAVIECGLGGRLDATNIIIPRLSIITNIGFDHMDILGDTLEKIAVEKAGIIKSGVPCLIGEYDPATSEAFRRIARERGSELHFADRMTLECEAEIPGLLDRMDLQGTYQRCNLRTVLGALQILGIPFSREAILHTACICDFHGRWEKLSDKPYTICDIGHNEHGLKYNFAQLDNLLDSGRFSHLVMVFGCVKDKDVDAVLRIIPSRAKIFFAAASSQRAMPAGELKERCGRKDAVACESVAAAVEMAREYCRKLDKPMIYVGGSTYVASEAIPLYE